MLYSGRVTLDELFIRHGIQRPSDLAKKVGLTRQYAHLLWTGKRLISRKMAQRIEAKTGIPYVDLMVTEPGPLPKIQRGRPRKPLPGA